MDFRHPLPIPAIPPNRCIQSGSQRGIKSPFKSRDSPCCQGVVMRSESDYWRPERSSEGLRPTRSPFFHVTSSRVRQKRKPTFSRGHPQANAALLVQLRRYPSDPLRHPRNRNGSHQSNQTMSRSRCVRSGNAALTRVQFGIDSDPAGSPRNTSAALVMQLAKPSIANSS